MRLPFCAPPPTFCAPGAPLAKERDAAWQRLFQRLNEADRHRSGDPDRAARRLLSPPRASHAEALAAELRQHIQQLNRATTASGRNKTPPAATRNR